MLIVVGLQSFHASLLHKVVLLGAMKLAQKHTQKHGDQQVCYNFAINWLQLLYAGTKQKSMLILVGLHTYLAFGVQ